MLKSIVKDTILRCHGLAVLLDGISRRKEPFLCMITPVFDPALASLKLLVEDLKQQSFNNFIHVSVSNGLSSKIKEYIDNERKLDERFVYSQIPYEKVTDYQSLLVNLGKRRRNSLKKFSAKRYLFLDADFKILDTDYFAKLYMAHAFIRKDVFVTKIIHSGRVSRLLDDFDMANFNFSIKVAKAHPFFTDLDPKFGRGNDFRYFVAINTPNNTAFLDIVLGEKDGNRFYTRTTDIYYQEKMAKRLIPVFGNSFSKIDRGGLASVLHSHLVGPGKVVEEFEDRFKNLIGFKLASATNSCTNAFWLLLRALQLKPRDEVIIPNIHFFGVKNVFELLGIKYRIVDVGEEVPNITFDAIKKSMNKNTKAIIFLEYGGYPVEDVDKIKKYLSSLGRRDVKLILDASNSPLTKFKGKFSALEYDFALYSFDMNKIIVTGDGGMILSNNSEVMARVKGLVYHGISDGDKTGFDKSKAGDNLWWEIRQTTPSLMLSMNNLAASLGVSQLDQVEEILEKRRLVRRRYLEKLSFLVSKKMVSLPPESPRVENNLFFFWIMLGGEEVRDKLARFLLGKGIYTTVKYQPLDEASKTPNSLSFYKQSLCLPLNQNLSVIELDYIIEKISDFLS